MPLRTPLTRGVALVLVALGGTAGVCAAATTGGGSGDGSSDPRVLAAGDALRVAVEPDGGKVLRTADGRTVRLRGANVNALVDYAGVQTTVPVTPTDGVQARALGFSVVRLAVSWSKIAPQPGVYDAAYLGEIRTAARAFTDQGVRVLLDLHQDRYAAGLGPSGDESDGAPAWAALTDGASTTKDSGGHGYYGTAAAKVAAQSFFANRSVAGKGLQEHYADALVRVAAIGEELGPGLAGVELYNEPVDPFTNDPNATDTFSPTRLWPFYRLLIERLRSADGTGPGAGAYDGPIWFGPQATRTSTDDDRVAAAFSDDPNLVYAPHIYTDVYNGQIGAGTYGRLEASFDNAASEARRYGAALAPDELPGAQTGPWELHRGEVLRHLDRLDAGGVVWLWKQTVKSDYGWGVLDPRGGVRADSTIARDYGRARLQASSAGATTSTWSAGVLTVRTTAAGTLDLWDGAAFSTAAPTVGAAPVVTVDGAAPAAGTLTGRRAAASLSSATEWTGGRELRLTVPAGAHTVVLRPAAAGESPTPAPLPADEPGTDPPPTTTSPPTTTTTSTTPSTGTTTATTPSTGTTTATTPAGGTSAARPTTTPQPPAPGRPSASRPAGSGTPTPASDAGEPIVSRVVLKPRRFRPAVGGRGGTTLTVTLRTAARLRVVLQRREAGRRSGSRCVPATRRRASGARCTRWVTATTQRRSAAAGRNVVRLTGRAAGRALPAGSYRVVLTATADDRTSTSKRVAVTLLAPSR